MERFNKHCGGHAAIYTLIHIPEQFIRPDHPLVDNRVVVCVCVIAGCQLGVCAVL
jgi:hypothetical protein